MKIKLTENQTHKPVLADEVLRGLGLDSIAPLKKPGKYIDATLGHAGYVLEIVKKKAEVLGIDIDKEALKVAKQRLKQACPPTFGLNERGSFKLVLGNFKDIDTIAVENNFTEVDGIIFDLGVSSRQLMDPSRGFSFSNPNASLDMRMNKEIQNLKASDLLNLLRKDQLEDLFCVVMHKGEARRLSSLIIQRRVKTPFNKVEDLLEVVGKNLNFTGSLHPATKAFLALRMAVNSELENISISLPKAFELLKPGGRLLVISFHSAEDTIVKNYFRKLSSEGAGKLINNKPIVPTLNEISQNPRSRSAKLRIIARE